MLDIVLWLRFNIVPNKCYLKMTELKNPQILTTNRLLDGEVVFFANTGWKHDIAEATVAYDEAMLQQLKSSADKSVCNNEVLDYYAVDVEIKEHTIQPVAIRERIRVTGPTINYRP